MLNVDTIKNGLVIDHIRSGCGIKIFNYLGLDKAEIEQKLDSIDYHYKPEHNKKKKKA